MFDAGTAALIRTAPAVDGIEPENLPQDLTKAYAELVALRLRVGEPDADAASELNLDRLLRIAIVYEAIADTARVADERRGAAFVAATAFQIVGRVGATTEDVPTNELLGAAAIHPLIAAPLLFLIAGQSPDAREAGRRLQGLVTGDLMRTALLETIADLSAERFEAILQRASRLQGLRSNPEATLEFQATQALYGLCWSGVTQLVAEILDQPVPASAFRQFERPQDAFARVEWLSLEDLVLPDEGATLVTSFTGPRHLARLLRPVTDGMVGSGLATLPAPPGVNAEVWRAWNSQSGSDQTASLAQPQASDRWGLPRARTIGGRGPADRGRKDDGVGAKDRRYFGRGSKSHLSGARLSPLSTNSGTTSREAFRPIWAASRYLPMET